MSRADLTVLTAMLPQHRNILHGFFSGIVKKISNRKDGVGGHYAVTRSLVEGLKLIGANFNYNPVDIDHVGKTVVVLADRGALEQAIGWKRSGKITRLIAGPNLVVLPSDLPDLITAPEIDVYLVNSEWTYKAYLDDAPILSRNCTIWAAGIDPEFWRPSHYNLKDNRILIYHKKAPEEVVEACRKVVEQAGFSSVTLKYGEYNPAQFLDELEKSETAIFLSRSESQGIALLESWAVDVPTIAWNPGWLTYNGKILNCSAAPYLTAATGLFFTGVEDFGSTFNEWKNMKESFSPRKWVVNNMTDKICAMKLLELAKAHL